MANGTIAFDTLSTSGQIDGVARSIDTDFLLNGCAKAWLQGTTSAVLSDSFNISGGTDNGVGDYTYALSNNMANNQWSQTCTAIAHELVQVKNITLITSAISVAVFTRADSLAVADAVNFVTLHGELA